MLSFPAHKLETVSAASKAALEASQQTYGAIPNLHGLMTTAPRLLEAWQALNTLGMQNSLTNPERHVTETVPDAIMGIGMKTLSNYTNHVANTPLDAGFRGYKWKKTADLTRRI